MLKYFSLAFGLVSIAQAATIPGSCTAPGSCGDLVSTFQELNVKTDLNFVDADGSNYMGIKSPSVVTADTVLTLPDGAGSNGEILTTDGTGTLSWSAIASGLWTGSGSDVYFSSGKVGIGTSTPANNLHVYDPSHSYLKIEAGASAKQANVILKNMDQQWSVGVGVDDDFAIYDNTAGSDRFHIDNVGNVGVGTITPGDKLDVVSDSGRAVINAITEDNTGANDLAGFQTKAPDNAIWSLSHGAARTLSRFGKTLGGWNEIVSVDLTADGTAKGLVVGTKDSLPLVLGTNDVERLRIDELGNVGIGTTDPQRALHVKTEHGGTLTALAIENTDVTNGNGNVLSFRTTTTGVGGADFQEMAGVVVKHTEHDHATRASDVKLFATDEAVSPGIKSSLILKGDGKVGVGFDAPTNDLQIGNTGHTGYALASISEQYGAIIQTGESTTPTNGAALWIRNLNNGGTPNEIIYAQNNGNVGIGTLAPTANLKLDVEGNIGAVEYCNEDGTTCEDADVLLGLASASGGAVAWEGDATNTLIKSKTSDGTADSGMVVTDTGNVGIGTNSPDSALHIDGVNKRVLVNSPLGGEPGISLGTDGSPKWSILRQGSAEKLRFYEHGPNADRIVILPGGNVGIGTTAPDEKFQVQGNVKVFNDLIVQSGSGGGAGSRLLVDSQASLAHRLIQAKNDNGTRFVVNGDGNVGIGMENPGEKLVVDGSIKLTGTTPTLWFNDGKTEGYQWNNSTRHRTIMNGNTVAEMGRIGTDNGQLRMKQYSIGGTADNSPAYSFLGDENTGMALIGPDELTLSTGAVSRLYVGADGNIGVGTTSPITKFDIQSATVGEISKHSMYVNRTPEITGNVTSYDKAITATISGVTIPAGVTDSGYKIAIDANGYINNNTGFEGTLASNYGVWARAGIHQAAAGSVVNNSYGLYADIVANDADATINNAYGVYIATGTTTPITNNYGLYQAQVASKNYFAGNLGIKTTDPQAALDVSGDIEVTGDLIPAGFQILNGVVISDTEEAAATHLAAVQNCASQGARVCNGPEYRQAGLGTNFGASYTGADAQLWWDGNTSWNAIESCGATSCSVGATAEAGWHTGNAYVFQDVTACADRCTRSLNYYCCN